MRTTDHYRSLLSQADTIGRQLLARAIATARYGPADHKTEIIAEIMREIGEEQVSRDDALALLDHQGHWKKSLRLDPIPSWAIQAALDELVDSGAIDTGSRNRGQTWLARAVDVDPSTVRRWVSGASACRGTSARVVREELFKALGLEERKIYEVTGLKVEAPEDD